MKFVIMTHWVRDYDSLISWDWKFVTIAHWVRDIFMTHQSHDWRYAQEGHLYNSSVRDISMRRWVREISHQSHEWQYTRRTLLARMSGIKLKFVKFSWRNEFVIFLWLINLTKDDIRKKVWYVTRIFEMSMTHWVRDISMSRTHQSHEGLGKGQGFPGLDFEV